MPSRLAFGLTNLFDDVRSSSPFKADLPASNSFNPRPRVVAASEEGNHGWVELRASTGRYIDIDEGGGEVNVSLTSTTYGEAIRREDFALRLENELNLAGGLTYDVYFTVEGRLRIDASGTFSILWDTGTNSANNIGPEMGFDTTDDDTGASTYIADEARFSTVTVIVYDLGAATAVDLFALILDGDDDTDYGEGTFSGVASRLRIHGHASALPPIPQVWADNASLTLTPSPRPAEDENTLQVAYQSAPSSYRYCAVVWHHLDESQTHHVGLAGAFAELSSNTRTLVEIDGHGLIDAAEALGVGNAYPAPHEIFWRLPLGFDEWEEADYRTVIHAAVRHSKTTPLLVLVRYAGTGGIEDGTLNAEDEADKGLVLWGSVVDFSLDSFSGASSAYLTGELVIEQVR